MQTNEPPANATNHAPLPNRTDPPAQKRPKAVYRKPVLKCLGALGAVGMLTSDISERLRHR